MRFTDSAKIGSVKKTKEGYLVATARVARTGVQNYLASELGDIATNAGFKPGDVVRVNRPESEVFSDKSLNTLTRLPATVDHPAEQVTSDNWAKYSVGDVGDAYARDGEWIVVNPMIKDANGVQAAQTTHKEISMGYTANIVVAADKSIADFEMQDISFNHLALVPKGRAGEQARIGDSWGASPVADHQPGSAPNPEKGGHMTTKTVVLGDKAVQVLAEDAAEVEQFKAASTKALADAKAEHKTAIEAKDEEIGTLKADLAAAKAAAVIDVDKLVADRSALVTQVKAIDAKIDPTGKTDAELRKAAVASRLGDEMVADAGESEINGMFKAIAKDAKPADPVRDAFSRGVTTHVGDEAAKMHDALAKANEDHNAWRYAQGGNQ